MRRRTRVFPLLLAVIGLVGAFGFAVALSLVARDDASPTTETGGAGAFRGSQLPDELTQRPAPRIRLTDARGLPVDTHDLIGQPYLVTFLFTNCPDVCPLIGQQVKQALGQLGARGRNLTALVVSVDPRGDTPEAVRRWLRRQRMPGNVRYLIGTAAELEPVWARYYASPQDPARPETSSHSAAVWLIDDEGRIATKHDAGNGIRPEDLAHDLNLLL